MIVEARREWLPTPERRQRTFYISEFGSGNKKLPASEDGSAVAEEGSLLPQNDVYVGNLNVAPKENRSSSKYHPENNHGCGATKSFPIVRTKFKGYNYSCSSLMKTRVTAASRPLHRVCVSVLDHV